MIDSKISKQKNNKIRAYNKRNRGFFKAFRRRWIWIFRSVQFCPRCSWETTWKKGTMRENGQLLMFRQCTTCTLKHVKE